ncbi:glycine receptor subunit alpha-2-like isoform X6 [Amphiura filiformis]|uniref:glycine receptor subunit alpha-2-like isoform X6 n=1 Tax=Amphiura filiformis TaxID=82378 RepID=UPI003B217D76
MASILWPMLTVLLIRQSLAHNPTMDPLYMSLGTPLERNTSRVLTMLLNGYDKRLRPNYGGEPVLVNVSMMVYSIGPINEVLMEYTVDMYFRTEWVDPRLTYTEIDQGLNLNAEMVEKVWIPDAYFVNEKDARFHDVIAKNSLIRLTPDGRILFSCRITVIASCGMNLAYFPMDKQRCHLVIESYAYSDKDIQFSWILKDPIWVDNTISLPQFTILGFANMEHTAQYYVGNYSQLHCTFYLGREISYYLIQAYMPATLIVVVSWLSFWIHRTATPARVALGITTVLTMTTLMGNAGSSLPKLSYVKSIDIYLGMCYFYVFSALLEFSVVCYFDKPRFKEARTRRAMIQRTGCGLMERRSVLRVNAGTEVDEIEVALDGSRGPGPIGRNNGSKYTQVNSSSSSPFHRPNRAPHQREEHAQMGQMSGLRECHRYSETAEEDECCHLECCHGLKSVKDTGCDPGKIDKNSRVFFPVTFLLLSIVYWSYYQFITDVTVEDLVQEDKERLHVS